MTPLWTAAEAAAATSGQTTGDWVANGVSIDTRTIGKGDLFVALKDVRDGHDFVVDALAKGASAALVSRVPDGVAADAPLLIVDDVLAGLERLGQAARARTKAKVVAVTGSVGKTSTKEMLRAVLAGQGRVHAAEASYNNHWGVPLTLARMPVDTDFAVIEIGMNHPGEIAPLSKMARPHVAMITTVAAAHLEAFDDILGIAREKATIFDGLEPDGTCVINGDLSADIRAVLTDAATQAGGAILCFGTKADCQFRALDITLNNDKTIVRTQTPSGPLLFKLNSAGRHFASNGLGVIAVADALGFDLPVAGSDLGRWKPPAGRGTRERVYLDAADPDLFIEMLDDAFNANPTSLRAALEVLEAAQPVANVGRIARGRRIAILGDMLELGPDEAEMHTAVASEPTLKSIDVIHCIGPRMRHLYNALPVAQRGQWHEAVEGFLTKAPHVIDAGDVVLVKGSKGSRVSRVVDVLRKLGQSVAGENDEG